MSKVGTTTESQRNSPDGTLTTEAPLSPEVVANDLSSGDGDGFPIVKNLQEKIEAFKDKAVNGVLTQEENLELQKCADELQRISQALSFILKVMTDAASFVLRS